MKPNESLKELAVRLQRWLGVERAGAKEILVWYTGEKYSPVGVAFRGDALKIKRSVLMQPVRNPAYRGTTRYGILDESLALALGVEQTQYFPSDEAHAFDFTSGVEQAASKFLEGEEEAVRVTFMPLEGAPWSVHNDPTPYVSGKTGRVTTTSRPDFLIEVETDEGKELGANPCLVAPLAECATGYVMGTIRTQEFVLTHTFSLETLRYAERTAELVNGCGGLLYPSLAIGEVPATNFGHVVLVADVGLVLASMRPYKKKKGAWPIVVYETDAWTATTLHTMKDGAVELFVELTGAPVNWTYKSDFWVLGPPLQDHLAKPLSSTKQLAASLRRRARAYERELDAAELTAVREKHFESAEKYAYLEAKSNAIVPMSCFPLAVCPIAERSVAHAFLTNAGFGGELCIVDYHFDKNDEAPIGGRDPRWDYAWQVRDVIVDYASSRGLDLAVETV